MAVRRHPEPYFEELQHVINDHADDLGIPLPDKLIQYQLSKWASSDVPLDHPLIQNRNKWLKVYYDIEYDLSSPADAKQLWILVRGIAASPLSDNLGSFQEVVAYHESPDITGKIMRYRWTIGWYDLLLQTILLLS